MQDYLAHRLAAGEYLQRFGGLRQRKGAVDMRGDLAFRSPLHELFQVGAVLLRVDPGPSAPEHAADIAALEQREVERHLRNVTRGEADHQEAAFPGNGA